MSTNTYTWHIVATRDEVPGVTTLILKADGERPTFVAGQYLTILLPNFTPLEGKSYSISSAPQEELTTLTIRSQGVFSRALSEKQVGDTLTTSAPYGFFYPDKSEGRDLAFIAGGIGITPIASMIEDLLTTGYEKSVTLFYSNRTQADTVFKERISELARTHTNFSTHHFITREFVGNPSVHAGRITAEHVTTHLRDPNETDVFICGSIGFTKDVWKMLRDAGFESSQLYTEGFY